MQRSGPLTIFSDAKHWKTDVPSGLVVFLVAIPLCLGIALASGGSAMSGIIAGIVGGLIVTLFSNSSLGVSGPAAGLVAIVAPAILQLGFQNFLLAVVLSGIIQLALGWFKAGTIGYYFPTSVIKGMLAAIGLIIILKQIPHAFGYDKNPEGDLAFRQADGYNTFSEIGHALGLITPSALIITLVCLAILIFWQTKLMREMSFTKIIQGPLVAVVAGILLNLAFSSIDSMKLDKEHLVRLPVLSLSELPADSKALDETTESGQPKFELDDGTVYYQAENGEYHLAQSLLVYPHFKPSEIKSGKMQFGHGSHDAAGHDDTKSPEESLKAATAKLKSLEEAVKGISNEEVSNSMAPAIAGLRESLNAPSVEEPFEESGGVTPFRAAIMIFVTAITLAIVASLESLLCAEATDKLDPQRRQTDLNQELRAQGIGNIVSGAIGGLPVTQVIVRSSTNIQSGAQSRFASFVHGIFLIVCVLAIPGVLNLVPLASLAAILFVVGYKLAHPSKFKEMFSQGWTQFLPFIITIAAILWTDLLIGIGIGLIVSLFFILQSSYFKSLWVNKEEVDGRPVHRLTLAERVFFINKGNIQTAIQEIGPGSKVIIDASNTVHMDQDVLDIFSDFKTNAEFDNIEIEWIEGPGEGERRDPARVRDIAESGN
jgi:MFS superfamily sulfate permease-like transporter